jgi:transcriptional regulator GlxA family with amidase domain
MSRHFDLTSGASRPPALRRVVAFIHENADHDIGLADIAAAAQLTPRSVQYLFRRHLSVTPLEYLRRVRLDRAHRDLLAADPSVDTVNAIAGRWGFAHAGRFSVAYREMFGTPPSATLRTDWRRSARDSQSLGTRAVGRR